MTLKACFDRLAAWTVTGVTVLGLDDFNGVLPTSELPCLLPWLGGTGGEAVRPLGIEADEGRVVVHVEHLLIECGMGQAYRFYAALTDIDYYLAAVVDDLYLNANLLEPLRIADMWAGPIDLGANVLYWGITFRHRWVIEVT